MTQTRARHILVRTSEVVSENEARRRVADLRERITNGGADFAALAKAHSDDTASAARGGELDWIYPGDTVPDFERALQELRPGELSQPVKTPFGYHLIEVLERRYDAQRTLAVDGRVRRFLIERGTSLDLAEVLLTDRNGFNAVTTARTSDFVQSDEDWWRRAIRCAASGASTSSSGSG